MSSPRVATLSRLSVLGVAWLLACSETPGSEVAAAGPETAPQGGSGATNGAGRGATNAQSGGAARSGDASAGTNGATGASTSGASTGATGPAAGGTNTGGTASGGATTQGGGGTPTGGGGSTNGGAAAGDSTGATGGDSHCTGGDLFEPPAPAAFTETVNGVSFEMAYVPGGTFTLGCESGTCPQYADPVSGVAVSSYLIGKNEVTTALWNAVMGTSATGFGGSQTSITWYDSMKFACQLSQLTGKNYRMMTEAEFEYAAKNYASSLDDLGTGEEWAYNSWETAYSCGANATDPVGPGSGAHTQKTRRDAQGTTDNITGRLIRSIDGVGPALRLVISADANLPPDYVPPCSLCAPVMGSEPEKSDRDPRWVTGGDAHWTGGEIAIGNFDLRVWDDGTARLNNANGQWFTSNNIAFVFVPSTGSIKKYPYIFLDDKQGSLLSGESFMSGGFIGRIEKVAADNYDKPTLSGLQSGAELAAAAGDDFKMVDMVNIPESAKEQDPRLLDGATQGWFQDNRSAGGVHHYRKDVDPDEFRFTVNQGGQRIMLANGTWFTVNHTFLRVTHSTGYTTDYLYAVDSSGTFYHDSYQAYERADFRMFKLTANGSDTFAATCGAICSDEIPKGEGPSLYANMDNGYSTFVPAPCPAGGCK
jgi:hypothetical protein